VVRKLEKSYHNLPEGICCEGKAAQVLGYARTASLPSPPYYDSLIYFVERSQINQAINQPALFPLGDQVSQAVNCPYVNYRKRSSILPDLHSNKAMYVRGDSCVDCTQHPNSCDPTHSILTAVVPDFE